jgi:peptide/nickel transport system substrate-binding protein
MYVSMTEAVPAFGGTYVEGVVGKPTYINPLLLQTHDDSPDADIASLMYSSLFTYDAQGRLQPRLAERYEVSENGLEYVVTLREGVRWHDGEMLTADDVAFTFRIVQDPAYKSPIRLNWQGVDVSVRDERTVVFALKKSYFGFLDNLTVGILPKHVWEDISPEKFVLTESNLKPIGSGPYRFGEYKKDSNGNVLTYELVAFGEYFDRVPFISKVVFHFYNDASAMTDAYNRKEVMGVSNVSNQEEKRFENRKSLSMTALRQSRFFAVFFNATKNEALARKEVRQALSYGTNRTELIDTVLGGRGLPIDSPFLSHMKGFEDTENRDSFDADAARDILDKNGWIVKDGVREKDGTKLTFTLTTPDWPQLAETAEMLRKQWETLGVSVEVRALGVSDFQQAAVRPREYEALLYGEATSFNPDPYSFWHSGYKHDPGQNFALFDRSDVDDILATARETLDDETRAQKYRMFRDRVLDETPAVFLYSPLYVYAVNTQVRGIDTENINTSSDRLRGIERWYIDTKRVKK